jgi:hypothetical protein
MAKKHTQTPAQSEKKSPRPVLLCLAHAAANMADVLETNCPIEGKQWQG